MIEGFVGLGIPVFVIHEALAVPFAVLEHEFLVQGAVSVIGAVYPVAEGIEEPEFARKLPPGIVTAATAVLPFLGFGERAVIVHGDDDRIHHSAAAVDTAHLELAVFVIFLFGTFHKVVIESRPHAQRSRLVISFFRPDHNILALILSLLNIYSIVCQILSGGKQPPNLISITLSAIVSLFLL